MKKSFLILGAAAMLMASCSNDEVIDTARGRAIGFTSFVNNSTRADLTNNNLTDFAVWAVTYKLNQEGQTPAHIPAQIFVGDKVYRTTSRDMFTYDDTRYWVSEKDLHYRFSAIAPYSAYDGGNGPLSVKQHLDPLYATPTGGLELTYDNSKAGAATDLCYAFNTYDTPPENEFVEFDFKHLLSRVKFTFYNHFPSENSVIKVTKVTINDVPAKGELNMTETNEGLWNPAEGQTQFSFDLNPLTDASHDAGYVKGIQTDENGENPVYDYGETDNKYIIPFKQAQTLKVSFILELYVLDPQTGTYTFIKEYKHENCTLPAIEFKNNHSYNFVTNIDVDNIDPQGSLKPIKFNATVSGWYSEENADGTTTEKWEDQTVDHSHGTGTGGGTAVRRR